MDYDEEKLLAKAKKPQQIATALHQHYKGKISVTPRCRIKDLHDFDVWYTPEAEKKLLKHLGEDTEKFSLYATDGGYLPHLMDHDFLITSIGPSTSYYLKDGPEYYDEQLPKMGMYRQIECG